MLRVEDPSLKKEGIWWLIRESTRGSELYVKTSVAARLMNVSHVMLNRDCKWAVEETKGNLAHLRDLIYRDERGQWWVHASLDEYYTILAPGKAGRGEDPAWFYVRDMRRGPRPTIGTA